MAAAWGLSSDSESSGSDSESSTPSPANAVHAAPRRVGRPRKIQDGPVPPLLPAPPAPSAVVLRDLATIIRPLGGTYPEAVARMISAASTSCEKLSDIDQKFVDRVLSPEPVPPQLPQLARLLGLCPRTVARKLFLTGSILYHGTRALAASLLSNLLNTKQLDRIKIRGVFRSVTYDETPLAVRVRESSSGPLSAACTSKLLQPYMEMCILTENLDTGVFSCTVMPLPCPLQVLDRGTGVNLKHGLDHATSIPGFSAFVDNCCQSDTFIGDVSACDRASANRVAEDGSYVQNKVPRLRMPCMAHIASTGQGRSFAATSVAVDGIVALGILMRNNAGSAAEVQQIIAQVLLSKLDDVIDAEPHPSCHVQVQYLNAFLRSTLPGTDSGRNRACKLLSLLTGDVRSNRIVLRVVGGRANIDLSKWSTAVSEAILPSQIETFPRHRWVNYVGAISSCALLNLHSFFSPVIMTWLAGREQVKTGPAALADGGGASWCISSDSDCDEQCRKVVSAPAPVMDNIVAAAAASSGGGNTSSFVAFNNAQKSKCRKWVLSKCRRCDRVHALVLAIVCYASPPG